MKKRTNPKKNNKKKIQNQKSSFNIIFANDLAGITLLKTSESLILENKIQSAINGVYIDAESNFNTIKTNKIRYNTLDINNTSLSSNNQFDNNECITSNPVRLC